MSVPPLLHRPRPRRNRLPQPGAVRRPGRMGISVLVKEGKHGEHLAAGPEPEQFPGRGAPAGFTPGSTTHIAGRLAAGTRSGVGTGIGTGIGVGQGNNFPGKHLLGHIHGNPGQAFPVGRPVKRPGAAPPPRCGRRCRRRLPLVPAQRSAPEGPDCPPPPAPVRPVTT